MKIKVSGATGPVLDWMVAKALGALDSTITVGTATTKAMVLDGPHGPVDMRTGAYFRPPTDWSQGGPIIEREKITLAYLKVEGVIRWEARYFDDAGRFRSCEYGPTPLIAAMRCYVTSKLGGEVDVPEELA